MIYFDEDSDARFFTPEAGTMTRRDLDGILENLSRTAVTAYIVGVNAQMANFRNPVIESYLDSFDIRLGQDQPALRGNQRPWAYRRRANMAVLENNGIDSNAYLLEGARRLGIAPWVGVRMNDIHDGHDDNSQIHSALWRERPELRIPGNIPCENGFDFSRQEIRDMYADFIIEACNRYRPENVLLDWLRWPTFFPREAEEERAPLITGMLERLHERLGHPFACRVPLTRETALQKGLDVATWLEKGLLSHLFIGNYGCAPEFDAPVEQWRPLTGKIPVIVSLGTSMWSDGVGRKPPMHADIRSLRGMAAAAWWRGADGVHPFNYMSRLRPGPDAEEGRRVLNEIGDPEKLYALPRRHHIGWNDSEMRVGDLDQIFRIPGYFGKWRETHSTPAGSLPRKGPTTIILHTAKAPDHDAFLTTDAEGLVLVNAHPVEGPSPMRIPVDWLHDGTTIIETNSDVNEIHIDL